MKNILKSIGIAVLAVTALAVTITSTGCAHAGDKSRSKHEVKAYGEVVPPGWTLAKPNVTNTANGNQVTDYTVVPPNGTNDPGFWTDLVARPHSFLAFHETWTDESSGGGTFLLTDPTASSLSFSRTNQTALGGSHSASVGQIQSVITTNAVNMVTAAGSAVGNVVGTAISASTGSGAAVSAGANTANAVTKAVPISASTITTNVP